MWQSKISTMMSESGWGSGFRLPISNAENLELERELEKRHRYIQIKQAELDDIEKHNAILETSFKNTKDHIIHDTRLTNAKTSEIAAERELLKVAEKDGHHLTRECKLAHEAFNNAVKKNRDLVYEIETKKRDMTDLANLIEFDRKELAVIESKASDESHILAAIQEIGDQDAVTLRKYETRYKKATTDTGNLRRDLDAKVSLTRVMQAELDGITDRFRKLHKERGDIVSMWKETMIALTQRDTEMNDIAEMYQETDLLLRSATDRVNEIRKRLQTQEQAGSSSLMQLNKWDRKVMDVREEIKSVLEYATSLRDNILTYEIGIALASNEARELFSKSLKIDGEYSQWQTRIEAAGLEVAELREKAEQVSSVLLSAEERMKMLQDLRDAEERKLECFIKCLEREMYKKGEWSGKRKTLEDKWTHLELEIKGLYAYLQTCVSKWRVAVMTLEKRKASIYGTELVLISAQVKYKSSVNPNVEDSFELQDGERRLVAIKKELDEILKQKLFVQNQVRHMLSIHQRMEREKLNLDKEIEGLEFKSNEHRCETRSSEKNLDLMVGEYQTAIVDRSLMKLKLRQIMKMLQQEKGMLFCSESKRVMLMSSIKEKRSEIDAHSRILEMRKRGVQDGLTQIKAQSHLVKACIMKRRDRYEIIMKLMATPDDPNDVKSEAYYVLKMAQEREMLLMEVQRWEHRLAEAEKEMEGMTNVHMIMNAANTSLKDNLAPAGENSEEVKALDQLNAEEQEILLRRTRAKKYRLLLRDKLYETEQKNVIVEQEIRATNHFCEMKEALASKVQNELKRQREKVLRWSGMCNKIIKEIKPLYPENQFEMLQLDLKLRFTASKYESGVGMFERLLAHHPHVKKYFLLRLKDDETMENVYQRFTHSLSTLPAGGSSSSSSSSSGSSRNSMYKDTNNNTTRNAKGSSDSDSSTTRTYRSLLGTPKKKQNVKLA